MPATRSVAAGLSMERGADVHEVIRVRTANREPLALERAYFPAAAFPDLLDQRLTGSIYSLLARHYGQRPHTAVETLEPVAVGLSEATLLHIDVGTPVMLIERTAFTAAGLAVEFARDLFRSDRMRISLRTGISTAKS
jgi:GntR family transcriptional regulator